MWPRRSGAPRMTCPASFVFQRDPTPSRWPLRLVDRVGMVVQAVSRRLLFVMGADVRLSQFPAPAPLVASACDAPLADMRSCGRAQLQCASVGFQARLHFIIR